jgi:hypothetical protein
MWWFQPALSSIMHLRTITLAPEQSCAGSFVMWGKAGGWPTSHCASGALHPLMGPRRRSSSGVFIRFVLVRQESSRVRSPPKYFLPARRSPAHCRTD